MIKYIVLFLAIIFSFAFFIKGCDSPSYTDVPESICDTLKNIDNQHSQPLYNNLKATNNIDSILNIAYSDTNRLETSNDIEIPRLIDTRAEQILIREGYTCSYNQNTRNANWVAWLLTKEHSNGPWTSNSIPYKEDNDVIGYRQENSDWESIDLSDAGIDHGHICPAADNKWSKNAMVQSYLLTNMCPQNANLNRGIWEKLESRCRGWARHYGEVYITAGPIFYSKDYKTIGANKVGVPDAFYKVVLCLNKRPKALGFIFPNTEPEFDNIENYMVSVDNVEAKTKIDFFHNLVDSVEDKVEAKSDLNIW